MNADEQGRLRVELLVDPLVLCPGPDLSPIKPAYIAIIGDAVYGSQSDYVLAAHFSTIETGTRARDVTAGQLRMPLLAGSWGRINLIAAQLPWFYGLSSQVLRAESDPWAFGGPPSETELVRNITCRNIMALLADPQMVYHGEDYEQISHTLSSLVAETLITIDEQHEMQAIMKGGDVTHAFNLGLVDAPLGGVLAIDVQWALRGT